MKLLSRAKITMQLTRLIHDIFTQDTVKVSFVKERKIIRDIYFKDIDVRMSISFAGAFQNSCAIEHK